MKNIIEIDVVGYVVVSDVVDPSSVLDYVVVDFDDVCSVVLIKKIFDLIMNYDWIICFC
jgi:hypothetical protein